MIEKLQGMKVVGSLKELAQLQQKIKTYKNIPEGKSGYSEKRDTLKLNPYEFKSKGLPAGFFNKNKGD